VAGTLAYSEEACRCNCRGCRGFPRSLLLRCWGRGIQGLPSQLQEEEHPAVCGAEGVGIKTSVQAVSDTNGYTAGIIAGFGTSDSVENRSSDRASYFAMSYYHSLNFFLHCRFYLGLDCTTQTLNFYVLPICMYFNYMYLTRNALRLGSACHAFKVGLETTSHLQDHLDIDASRSLYLRGSADYLVRLRQKNTW
jgi:hypothetical protein